MTPSVEVEPVSDSGTELCRKSLASEPSSLSAFRFGTFVLELTDSGATPELTTADSPGPPPTFVPSTPAPADDEFTPLTPGPDPVEPKWRPRTPIPAPVAVVPYTPMP